VGPGLPLVSFAEGLTRERQAKGDARSLSARGAVFAERGLIQNVESAKITTRKNAHPL